MVDPSAADIERRTRDSFGLLWSSGIAPEYPTHLERVLDVVGDVLPVHGRVLDAGCGDGRDAAYLGRSRPDLDVVAIDLGHGVIQVRARYGATAAVAQASVLAPPFRPASFDLVYSYGVLHHTVDASQGFARLAELVAPRGGILVYVYSDLREEPALRLALTAVNALRHVTLRLPPRALLWLCRVISPLAWLLLGVPADLLRRSGRGGLAGRLPLNWVRSPAGASGDLYDRFSAPVETRHSAMELREWASRAGLADVRLVRQPDARGWILYAVRPGERT